jgi:DNA-binding protein H-NS
MAKANLSRMTVEALMDLRKRVDEMLLKRRAEIEKQLERMGGAIAVVGGQRGSPLRGRKVAIKYRDKSGNTWAGRGAQPVWLRDQADRLPVLVADLVRKQVAVIVGNTPSALAAKAATTTVPIVPVPLSADTLRPGTVYADPYGHILMIVRRIAQTEDAAGIILAVDGQPDGTVARKRFWRGNFLFAQDPALGGPGFKRFPPVVVANGAMRRLIKHLSDVVRNRMI